MIRVRVLRGDGWVVRQGDVIAVVRGHDAFVDEALDLIASPAPTGPGLLHGLRRAASPGCGFAAVLVGAGRDVVVVGDAWCDIMLSDGTISRTVGPSPQLIGLQGTIGTIRIGLDGAGVAADRSDLVVGVTPGAGAEMLVAESTPQGPPTDLMAPVVVDAGSALPPPPVAGWSPPSVPAPVLPAPIVNLLTDPADDLEPVPAPGPLPPTPDDMPRRSDEVLVRGVACGIGHVNRLDALYCSSCGRRLQQTVGLAVGPRPPLGTLIFDDGSTYGLERGFVIGRDPTIDPAVASGQRRPIVLDDGDRSISRVHAEIDLDDWDVVVIDRGSSNGTYVFRTGGTAWERLAPQARVVLDDGWSVAVGRRTFVYQRR